jgi:hypothetical protein
LRFIRKIIHSQLAAIITILLRAAIIAAAGECESVIHRFGETTCSLATALIRYTPRV